MTAPKCPAPWVRGATARAMLVDLVIPRIKTRSRGDLTVFLAWGSEGPRKRTRGAAMASTLEGALAAFVWVPVALSESGVDLRVPSLWQRHNASKVDSYGRIVGSGESWRRSAADHVAPFRVVVIAPSFLLEVGDAARAMVHACEVDRGVAQLGDLSPSPRQAAIDDAIRGEVE